MASGVPQNLGNVNLFLGCPRNWGGEVLPFSYILENGYGILGTVNQHPV